MYPFISNIKKASGQLFCNNSYVNYKLSNYNFIFNLSISEFLNLRQYPVKTCITLYNQRIIN